MIYVTSLNFDSNLNSSLTKSYGSPSVIFWNWDKLGIFRNHQGYFGHFTPSVAILWILIQVEGKVDNSTSPPFLHVGAVHVRWAYGHLLQNIQVSIAKVFQAFKVQSKCFYSSFGLGYLMVIDHLHLFFNPMVLV